MNALTELGQSLLALNEPRFIELVRQGMEAGDDPMAMIEECNRAIVEVGKGFEAGSLFISELIMSGEMFKQATALLNPLMGSVEEKPSKGTVVIGTVKDDIHDIGKNIVITLLKGAGYKVVDLGIDVSSARFVEAVRETGAKVLGLSALLSLTYPRMKEVHEALQAAGIRDKVSVIIGGAPCNEEVRRAVGADYYAAHAGKGVTICREVYGK